MAGRMKGNLTEKVDEIKRMQANWMRERSQGIDDGGESRTNAGGTRKSRDKTTTKQSQASKKAGSETMSWSMGNSAKKKPPSTLNSSKASNKQQTLRTRSASPARGTSKPAKSSASSSSSTNKRTASRPSSARSTTSEGSRPPSGRNLSMPQSEKSTRSDHKRTGGENEGNFSSLNERLQSERGDLGSRFHSEPNLNDFEGRHQDEVAINNRLHGDSEAHDSFQGPQSRHSLGHGQESTDDQRIVRGNHSSNQVDDLRSETRPKPSLDPDAFDRLADQIASRVKADMRDERQELMNRSGYTSQSILLDESNHHPEGYIEGHYCSKCKQLMVPPDHSAILLVPCGHTLCEACAEDRIKCPTCRTRVSSTSLNSTLQEIISSSRPNSGTRPLASHSQPLANHSFSSDVHQNHVSAHSTNHHPPSHRTQEYTPSRYADESGHIHSNQEGGNVHQAGGYENSVRTSRDVIREGQLHSKQEGVNGHQAGGYDNNVRTRRDVPSDKMDVARRRKMTREEEARKMEDEFQSLGIRCEALESEEADVMERVEIQNRAITQHKQQMGNIAQKQQLLREEIKGLEKRLADLEGHRQEYKRQVEDAEDRKKEELDQLAMVRTMLRDKQRSRERVKISARKLNISLD